MMIMRWCRRRLIGLVTGMRHALRGCFWVRPAVATHAAGIGTDLVRSRAQLLAENALLRQQLLVLRRSVTRPVATPADRAPGVAGRPGSCLAAGPAHRPTGDPAALASCRVPRAVAAEITPGGGPPLEAETVALIRRMAADNPTWGAERICGELGKLGLRVAKRTIQTYLRGAAAPRPRGQTWAAFLRNHARAIWAGDFLPVTDLRFRPLFAFSIIELTTRRVVHLGTTRHPTDA